MRLANDSQLLIQLNLSPDLLVAQDEVFDFIQCGGFHEQRDKFSKF